MQLTWVSVASLLVLAGCYDTTGAPDILTAKEALESTPILTASEYEAALAERRQSAISETVPETEVSAIKLPVPLSCTDIPSIENRGAVLRLTFEAATPSPEIIRDGRDAQADAAACLEGQGVDVRYETDLGVENLGEPLTLYLEFAQ